MRSNSLAAALAVGLAALAAQGVTQAQNFPARPVTFVVPWPAGGATDVALRALATATEKHLGQSIVIENRAGAGGTLGPSQMAASAKPDGYTIAQLPITVFRLPVIWGATRTKNWPTAPTLRDVGIDIVSNSPYGIGGPRGMDAATVKVLHDAFRKGLDEPSNLATMAQLDQERFYLSSEDYQKFAMQQIVEQKRMIEELGLKEN